MAYLLDLKAVEAADVIERAFRAGDVDEMVVGDWPDVQQALGLTADHAQPCAPLGTSAPVYELSGSAGKTRSQPPVSPQSAVEARLAQALRDSEREPDAGPKRKHHRKHK